MMRLRAGQGTFSAADLEMYAQAWCQPEALTSMIPWYRAAFRESLRGPWNPKKITLQRVKVPTLMLWGANDVALSREMVQPSIDLCEEGRLVYFENASHWVQHDEAEGVTRELLEFFGS